MLKKRIIPCLDVKDDRTVKGRNFVSLADAGDPVVLAERYVSEGADELVFLDITATVENRKTIVNLVRRVAEKINIPFTVGGGVASLNDVSELLKAGADKVSINSEAVYKPQLITSLAREFGSQCVVVAIDTAWVNNDWIVFTAGGRKSTHLGCAEWAARAEQLGAGEILLTSIGNDGVRDGYAIDITEKVCESVNIPVIASGGAGKMEHFRDLFNHTGATAALAASVFHYGHFSIKELKEYLRSEKVEIR